MPWEEYDCSTEALFPNGTEDRSFFNDCAAESLDRTQWALQQMILYFQIQEMRIFIVEGYDVNFKVVLCTLEEMFEGLKRQMWETGDFEDPSKVYYIGSSWTRYLLFKIKEKIFRRT